MGWFTVVAALNGFVGSYAVGLLLTFTALMAAIGFGARSMQPVYWFAAYGLTLVTVAVLVVPAVRMSPVLLIASLVTVALGSGGRHQRVACGVG